MPHFCPGCLAKAELATSLELLLATAAGLRLAQGPMPQSSAVLRGGAACRSPSDALPPAR
jgi:hypothetical protein